MPTGHLPPGSYRHEFRRIPALVAASLLAAFACTDRRGPVGSVEVAPATAGLAYAQCATFQVTWKPTGALGRLRGQPIVFVHLLDSAGDVVRTFDHPLPAEWRPARTIAYPLDLCQSGFGPPLVSGPYDLSIGLVDARSGRRFELSAQATKPPRRREYVLGTVVVPASLVAPGVAFGPEWRNAEPSRDRQVLMRRQLDGDGSLSVRGLPGRGILRLDLTVTPHTSTRSPGGVSLGSPATAAPRPLVRGRQVLELASEGADLEVSFTAPGRDPSQEVGAGPWLVLESLAWKPAPAPRQ